MRFLFTLTPVLLLALAGCGSQSLPPQTDPAKGREVLKTVLETWKRGGSADGLKTGSPSITAHDPDWSAGAKLSDYEIAPEDKRSGVDLVLAVKLKLLRPDGRPQEKKVRYVVAAGASTVVVRGD
jgi:hypothetical protein